MERHGNIVVGNCELSDLTAEIIASGGRVEVKTKGYSMQPMLTFDQSEVRLEAAGPLRRGDVILYRYPDGKCVIHRIVRVNGDGTLECRGDHNLQTESGVRPEWVLATVTAFTRRGRWIPREDPGYRLYWNTWLLLWPARRALAPVWRRGTAWLRRNFGKKGGESS